MFNHNQCFEHDQEKDQRFSTEIFSIFKALQLEHRELFVMHIVSVSKKLIVLFLYIHSQQVYGYAM